ncbi:MAG TPA: hypothetical protein VGL71_04455 [Urbifossiella sp.]
MSKKKHAPGPVPAGNRSHSGTSYPIRDQDEAEPVKEGEGSAEAFQEEDPQRRMGDFTGTADHARQQPGPKNDGGKMHSENG